MKKRIKQWFKCWLGFHEYVERVWSLGFTRTGTLVRVHGYECKHCGEETTRP